MIMIVLVTVKLPKTPEHDPRNKITGRCPVNGQPCTDVTGEHHTMLLAAEDLEDAQSHMARDYPGTHVTRYEVVNG
jgi:hypothetical protein